VNDLHKNFVGLVLDWVNCTGSHFQSQIPNPRSLRDTKKISSSTRASDPFRNHFQCQNLDLKSTKRDTKKVFFEVISTRHPSKKIVSKEENMVERLISAIQKTHEVNSALHSLKI
jgi:hypothetical protein